MNVKKILACSLLAAGTLAGMTSASAGGAWLGQSMATVEVDAKVDIGVEGEATDEGRLGPFDGINRQKNKIWIDDHVYRFNSTLKVIGNDTKLGSLSAIGPGEIVEFTTEPDPRNPNRLLVVEIRRL